MNSSKSLESTVTVSLSYALGYVGVSDRIVGKMTKSKRNIFSDGYFSCAPPV